MQQEISDIAGELKTTWLLQADDIRVSATGIQASVSFKVPSDSDMQTEMKIADEDSGLNCGFIHHLLVSFYSLDLTCPPKAQLLKTWSL
jgi:hypothetical protein